MNVALRQPRMTREQFLDWAERQDAPYEFDGFEPVAMTGGSANHSQTTINILLALRTRLAGSGCRPLGPDAGVATVGGALRYPDALVTCATFPGTDKLISGVVVVFEVLSPGSGRVDRIVKVREYAAVPSIRRYVMLEHAGIGVTVLARTPVEDGWTATALSAGEVLSLPEIGIEIPVDEFYEGVDLPEPIDEGR